MDNIESIILGCLVTKDDYSRQVIPFMKTEYFRTRETKSLFENIQSFIVKYNALPSKEAMSVLYRVVNFKSKDKYTIAPYKPNEDTKMMMKEMPMDAVMSSMVFFYDLGKVVH